MINSFQEVALFSGEDFKEHLERTTLIHIFEPVLNEYIDFDLCAKIIKYIAFANSLESPKISVGGDRRKELHSIFRDMEIPTDIVDPRMPTIKRQLYGEIVLLENDAIIESTNRWLRYKDNRQLEYLFTLQNAYVQHQAAALKDIRKSSGETDYDQKFKCIGYMKELKKQIADAESELQQNDEKLKEAYEEVKIAKKKVPSTGPEAHAW